MKVVQIDYGSPAKQVLAIPDHYVALAYYHPKATAESLGLAVLEKGRYIVKAGTLYREGAVSSGKVVGVVLNDYDVTDGDDNLAVVLHGFIKVEAMPVPPSSEEETALPMIKFIKKVS